MDQGRSLRKKRKLIEEASTVCLHTCKRKDTCGHACCKNTVTYGQISVTRNTEVSVAKVLGTRELVERILTFLPKADLLRAMRACKSFHNIFNSSQSLRDQLFLSYRHTNQKVFKINSRYQIESTDETDRDILTEQTFPPPGSALETTPRYIISTALNDLLFVERGTENKAFQFRPPRSNQLHWLVKPSRRLMQQSCAQMFITIPPTQSALVQWARGAGNGVFFYPDLVNVVRRNGITLGDIISESLMRMNDFDNVVLERSYVYLVHTCVEEEGDTIVVASKGQR